MSGNCQNEVEKRGFAMLSARTEMAYIVAPGTKRATTFSVSFQSKWMRAGHR